MNGACAEYQANVGFGEAPCLRCMRSYDDHECGVHNALLNITCNMPEGHAGIHMNVTDRAVHAFGTADRPMIERGSSPMCEHKRLTSTLMWPEEANSIRCEDCGHVLREAWSNVPKGS